MFVAGAPAPVASFVAPAASAVQQSAASGAETLQKVNEPAQPAVSAAAVEPAAAQPTQAISSTVAATTEPGAASVASQDDAQAVNLHELQSSKKTNVGHSSWRNES